MNFFCYYGQKKNKPHWYNPVFHADGFICLGFPPKSTEWNRKIPFEISGLRVGPLAENVETVNEGQIYLPMGVYDEKKLDPTLLFPHFHFSDSDFKIKIMREREGEQLSLNTAL